MNMLKFYIGIMIIALCCMSNAFANMQKDLEHFFHKRGLSSNVTNPGGFRDQQGGYYSGGSIMARAPAENTHLMSLQPPITRGGCGGIDLYMGGFSYINSQSLVRLMNVIGSNASSFASAIALQTVSPQIKSVIDYLMGLLQDVNNTNINSCNAAATLVGGLMPKSEAASQVLCRHLSMEQNRFSDYTAAHQGCGSHDQRFGINKSKQRHKAFVDQLGDEFNLAWKALKKNNYFNDNDALAELFMSISGSIIARKVGDGIQVAHLPSLAKSEQWLKRLIDGKDGTLSVYRCDERDEDSCLHPFETDTTVGVHDYRLCHIVIENVLPNLRF